MQLPYIPTNSREFIALMEEIWEMRSAPSPDGGITISQSPFYDQWHDPIDVAQLCARRTGMSINGTVWRFPDRSGVTIGKDHNSVRRARAA